MKKLLLFLCILAVAVAFAHELCLDAFPTRQVSFSEIPVLTEKEERRMLLRIPWMTDAMRLSADGYDLPTDDSGLYYTPAAEGITVQLPARAKIARTPWRTDKQGNTTCRIIRYDGVSRSVCRLLVTGLPVFDLQLVDRKSESVPIGDSGRQLGLVRLFSADASGAVSVQAEAVTVRVRGASSRKYKKKSYTIAFVGEDNAARKASFLDMPADTEYGLNSLYEDDCKVREKLALEVWAILDEDSRKDGEPSNAISMHFTEVLIDGQYWGLYGLQQLITPDAFSLGPDDGLFKINGYFESTGDRPIIVTGEEIVQDTPAGNGEALLKQAFAVLPDYTKATVPTLDWDSAINYGMLLDIICGTDNDARNMACCYRAETDAFYMIGWDLDQSFGQCWTGTGPLYVHNDFDTVYSSYLSIHEWKTKPFPVLYCGIPAFAEELHARYFALRENALSDNALLSRADELFDHLTDCGAREREAKRWPKGGYCADNGFLQTFIPARMAILDEYYAAAD